MNNIAAMAMMLAASLGEGSRPVEERKSRRGEVPDLSVEGGHYSWRDDTGIVSRPRAGVDYAYYGGRTHRPRPSHRSKEEAAERLGKAAEKRARKQARRLKEER